MHMRGVCVWGGGSKQGARAKQQQPGMHAPMAAKRHRRMHGMCGCGQTAIGHVHACMAPPYLGTSQQGSPVSGVSPYSRPGSVHSA